MVVRKEDVVTALAVYEPGALRGVLEGAGLAASGSNPRALAEEVAGQLWWAWCTPLGYALDRGELGAMVDHVGRRLRVPLGEGTAWERLRALTAALVRPGESCAYDDLDSSLRARLEPSWIPTAAFASTASGSLGAAWAGKAVLRFGRTPVGRLLPWIPRVGPTWRVIRRGAGVAATVGTPLAVGLAGLALDQAASTRYDRLVPLLLGMGLLGADTLDAAEEVVRP